MHSVFTVKYRKCFKYIFSIFRFTREFFIKTFTTVYIFLSFACKSYRGKKPRSREFEKQKQKSESCIVCKRAPTIYYITCYCIWANNSCTCYSKAVFLVGTEKGVKKKICFFQNSFHDTLETGAKRCLSGTAKRLQQQEYYARAYRPAGFARAAATANVARGVSVAHCRPARRFRYGPGARDAMMMFGTRLSGRLSRRATHHAGWSRAFPPPPPYARGKTVFSGVARTRAGETPPRGSTGGRGWSQTRRASLARSRPITGLRT